MNKLLNYTRLVVIFVIIELMITFVTSLLNLIGVKSGITQLIILISNIIIFFILSYNNAKRIHKKGIINGANLGLIFIVLMILLKIILFTNSFNIASIIYYSILLIVSIFGGMIGVNKKIEE